MAGTSAPLSVLEVYLNTNPMTNAAKAGAKAAREIGFEARILGRDILRLSGVVDSFAGLFMKGWSMMASSSLNLGAAMEDINWAIEDIAASIGDALSPILEVVADIMEKVADAFEGLPDPLKMIIGLVILGGIVFLTLTGLIAKLFGALTMLRGTMKATTKDASSLFDKFRSAFPWLQGNISQMEKLAILNGTLQDKNTALISAQLKLKDTNKELNKVMNTQLLTGTDQSTMTEGQKKRLAELQAQQAKYSNEVVTTKEEIAKLTTERDGATKGEKAEKKETKGLGDIFKSIGSTIKNLIFTFGPMIILFLALGPIIELISPILEAIGDAFGDVFERLEPVVDMIVDFIVNNEELVVAILLSLAGVMLFAKFIPSLTGALGKLGGVLGKVATPADEAGDALTGTGASAWKNIAALAALVLAITPLLLAINEILKTIGTFKFSLAELFGYLGTLSVNILAIVGALVFMIRGLSSVSTDAYKAVGVLIALSFAVDILIGTLTLFLTAVGAAGLTLPEVVGFLLSMASSVGILMAVMVGAFKSLGDFSAELLKGSAVLMVLTVPILIIIGAFTLLLYALAALGTDLPTFVATLFSMVAAISLLIGVMVGLVMVLGPIAPMAMMGAVVLLMLSAVVFILAGAFFLFAAGVQLLANAFTTALVAVATFLPAIIGLLPQIVGAVGGIIGLAGAFMLLGFALLFAVPGLILGAISLALLAGTIGLLAVAIVALAAALYMIPAWATGFVGGILGGIGGLFGMIPKLQGGGIVEKGGIAYLEPAEVVIPKGGGGAGTGPGSIYNTYNITATIREDADIDKLAKKISEKQSKEYGSRVY